MQIRVVRNFLTQKPNLMLKRERICKVDSFSLALGLFHDSTEILFNPSGRSVNIRLKVCREPLLLGLDDVKLLAGTVE
jgi:hypothetical protein